MNQPQQKMLSNLAGIFFISGLSALIYQVCWQRLLFTGFGVDLTSITVIVSAFMAGLGVGAFFGGRIADKYPQNIILIFCLIELGIGCFGFFSHKFIFSFQRFSEIIPLPKVTLPNQTLFNPFFNLRFIATLSELLSFLKIGLSSKLSII